MLKSDHFYTPMHFSKRFLTIIPSGQIRDGFHSDGSGRAVIKAMLLGCKSYVIRICHNAAAVVVGQISP